MARSGRGGGHYSQEAREAAVTMDDVREYLAGQDKTALVTLILNQAKEDERLS
jgi:hypothetical protein